MIHHKLLFLLFFSPPPNLKCLALLFPAVLSEYTLSVFLPSVLEKSEFKDDSQFFRFYADEEMEGTSSKSKQLQRNDFKLIENILTKSLVVSWGAHEFVPFEFLFFPPKLHLRATRWHEKAGEDDPPKQLQLKMHDSGNVPDVWNQKKSKIIK